ncbi:2-succinyl-5-enolpyruvyl-6-hydroxy-3-cyclohexene-1-carboxylate synthase [Butyrivibrio sp. X503]|uniref:thiamine pyrophosphate-binding protein n=1 Tax=Butyrivibrio sp. X503 TaxID=2364878 RepID=UPI000EA9D5E8|nr:thiamine pyrophosphate-binding protein [Butyrivibrio sp. X503]RKM54469.1 2-succinyl-5-enolpyruvyl-6-hydroxy-3-cyclohexene-1-carboxylate synthase [Butyrivibrio sp. X503]
MKIGNDGLIEIVIDLLKAHNIRHVVISPGGTNYGFVSRVQNDSFFKCYSVVDERSAVYFAIGLYLQTNETIAMSCTSAQATRNYIPGLTEAYYKKVPIFAITMCKHPRFELQGYMQAPIQDSLPVDCVKQSYKVPYLTDANDYLHIVRVINQAILELDHMGKGPVQLCVPKLDWSIDGEVKEKRTITRYSNVDYAQPQIKGKKILVVVGEHIPFNDLEKSALEHFCEKTNSCIYVNHLSNYSGKYSVNGNLLLAGMSVEYFKNNLCPDILITIGGQTGDYPLYNILSSQTLNNVEHWSVSTDGNVVDTYDKLTCVFQMDEMAFFNAFSENKVENHPYYFTWKSLIDGSQYPDNIPFSSVAIASLLHENIPDNAVVQFSILHSLRIWNFFKLKPSVSCFSNVGAFGIDGGLSTLIGQSFATDELCFMIIGDLAFYYDMNSIGIRGIRNNVRILIVNNNGGVEFKLGSGVNMKETDRYVAAAGHYTNAKGWAESCGFDYYCITSEKEFEKVVPTFTSVSNKPIIIEAMIKDVDEVAAHESIIELNSKRDLRSAVKHSIKNSVNAIIKKH